MKTKNNNSKTEGKNHAKNERWINFFRNYGNNNFNSNFNLRGEKMQTLLDAYEKMAIGFRTLKYQKKIDAMDLLNSIMEVLYKRDLVFDTELEAYWYIKKAMIDKTINSYRDIKKFDLLKKANCLEIESKEFGVTEVFINEVITEIDRQLKGNDKAIFKLYFIEGYTAKEIGVILDSYEMAIHRRLKDIEKVIHNLQVNYFYQERYVRYTPKKKREKISYPDYQENDGEVIDLDLGDYEPMEFTEYENNFDLNGNYVFLEKDYYNINVTATQM